MSVSALHQPFNQQVNSVQRLTLANINDCMALQQAVLNSLPPDQDKVHPKTREKFAQLLADDSPSTIFGIFEDGQLVAQAIMLCPRTIEEADLLDFELPGEPHEISTLAGVLTNPAYEGRGYMSCLVNAWREEARALGRPHLCGIVTRDNTKSWSGFMNGGLVIMAAGFDPSDNSTVYLVHRDISRGPALSRSEQSILSESARNNEYHPMSYRILTPTVSLEEANEHFAEGYVGVERAYERNRAEVVLVHRACLDYYLGIK
ncbi:MAG: GNAT family N-acetyltransferase [Alphaproteobacteria bacterium]|nr:GNAT family N-acetyltransferase [Alphaproteobacteria bacterium]